MADYSFNFNITPNGYIPEGPGPGIPGGLFVTVTPTGIPANSTLTSITIKIHHYWVGDLRVILTNPDSTSLVLFTRLNFLNGNCNGSNVDAVFLRGSVTDPLGVDSANPGLTGTFRPYGGDLSLLDVSNSNQTWTLNVRDEFVDSDPLGTNYLIESTLTFSGVVSSQDISPTSISSDETFGTAVITVGSVSLLPTSINSDEAFGTAVITVGSVSLSPTSISSSETFGTAVITVGSVSLLPTSISSDEAFGTAVLNALNYIIIPSIASTESFGTIDLSRQYIPPAIETLPEGLYKPCPDKFKRRTDAYIPYCELKRMFGQYRATYNKRKQCIDV